MTNPDLLQEISNHIFQSLNVLSISNNKSICDSSLLTNNIIEFEHPEFDCSEIYGVQALVDGHLFKMMAARIFGQEIGKGLFFLVVHMENCPIYGLKVYYENYLDFSSKVEESAISYNVDGGDIWIPTTTFLQATFLAGLEQIKEMGISFKVLDDSKLFALLKSFMISCQEDGDNV